MNKSLYWMMMATIYLSGGIAALSLVEYVSRPSRGCPSFVVAVLFLALSFMLANDQKPKE